MLMVDNLMDLTHLRVDMHLGIATDGGLVHEAEGRTARLRLLTARP